MAFRRLRNVVGNRGRHAEELGNHGHQLPAVPARKRRADAPPGTEAAFSVGGQAFSVLPGDSPDHKFFRPSGTASSIGFRRLSGPPAICAQPTANDPLTNFDIFWTTFDEHYPFFAMHGIDWHEVREKVRPTITSETSPEQLFDVLKSMIEPLHDAHTSIGGSTWKQRFQGWRANASRIDDKTSKRIKEIIESNYVHDKLKSGCNGQLSYGELPGGIGYLRITAFSGYTIAGGFDRQLAALDETLDKAFADADKLRGLVVDVRINHGGSDVLGVAVASRLAAKEYLAFAKRTRNDPADPTKFTPPQETRVTPSDRPHFHGKAVLLTGSNAVSAGETFTMALMGAQAADHSRGGEHAGGFFRRAGPEAAQRFPLRAAQRDLPH